MYSCYALFVLIYDIVAWIKDMAFPLTLTMILLPILVLIKLSEHQIRKIDKENKQEKNN